jgi:acetyltransferase-like isoleucine patch superfamily enzyme
MIRNSISGDALAISREASDLHEYETDAREGPPPGCAAIEPPIEPGRTWAQYLARMVREPSLVIEALNARYRLRGLHRLPLTTRLVGRARVFGHSRITLGDRVLLLGTTVPVEIAALGKGRIDIGDGTSINYGTSIAAYDSVTIGRNCRIGQYVIINDNDFHDIENKLLLPPSRPVILEDGVWLGARVIVQKGVHIGHDAVIGAGSVVTRDIPARCVAAGMPARAVRWF